GVVVVAQVLVLPVGRPRRIHAGEVVIRACRTALERTSGPHARERPAIEIRRRRHGNGFRCGDGNETGTLNERHELVDVLTGDGNQLAGCWVFRLGASPGLQGITTVQPTRQRSKRLLSGLELACGNRQQTIDWESKPLFELEFLLEFVAAEAKRGAGPRGDVRFQMLDVGAKSL